MPDARPVSERFREGWAEAEMNTLRYGASLSLYQKIQWLEEIEEMFLNMQKSRQRTLAVASTSKAIVGSPSGTGTSSGGEKCK